MKLWTFCTPASITDCFLQKSISSKYAITVCTNGFNFKSAKYNVPTGKKIRGLLCVAAFKAFSNGSEQLVTTRVANLVGWCIEMIQAGFLVHDDLIDNSPMRRGRTSWPELQKEAGLGLISINDGLHLVLCAQQLLFSVLGETAASREICFQLVKLFGDCAHFTCLGQALDVLASSATQTVRSPEISETEAVTPAKVAKLRTRRLSGITKERFAAIAKWKTSYYSFVLPVTAGMLLVSISYTAGVNDEKLLENAKTILLRIGEYFQAQDDFLDVFGDSAVTGKENYGRSDATAVAAVKDVFVELDLPAVYAEFETTIRNEILDLIVRFSSPDGLPGDFFRSVLDLLHRRPK
ncbi:unnamed protein product [Schistocephalus solidus]|uniref:Farnesyl pyrophosphate synthase n=1 Tax=Schistocephalus solidus TaxID=70667 RepID=A0A183SS55_SCHSO|nr:unnamed protein product [Schistocephalus solidus]